MIVWYGVRHDDSFGRVNQTEILNESVVEELFPKDMEPTRRARSSEFGQSTLGITVKSTGSLDPSSPRRDATMHLVLRKRT